jgi:hypothetical protein
MTEQQMWLKIAEAFDQYAQGAPVSELTSLGLCYALTVLQGRRGDTVWYCSDAHEKIGRIKAICSSDWGAYNRRNAAFRATVAGFLAAGMNP